MTSYSSSTPLPQTIGKPATRALHAHSIYTLEELCMKSLEEVKAYHGVGPKAIKILSVALHTHQLAFRVD
ncbi:hypothetical protein ACFO0S_02705 [Chryseomicrobium palamuruense]|uniref:DNA-binding protein n=1 Tax=Chryseomicrobium palamuruense TaxID=682973 RepID=A0ABV8URQ3_9BACL